jgi:phospholipase C
MQHNTAETLFERLEGHGRTWKVYVQEPMSFSAAALIHMSRLKDRLATNFVPFSEFEHDVANGSLPDFSMIEPNLIMGHSDYHPAAGRALPGDIEIPLDPPSSIRGGEAFLARIYEAIRSAASPEGSNAYNTMFFIGWDEPGGTYDHVPPGPVPPPDPSAPAGEMGFKFDRSGYRVPAIIVSPWVDEGIVINEEHRHTSMIATLRKVWNLGDAFSARDAAAAPFDHLLSRESPRDPATWPDMHPLPVPAYHMDEALMSKALSTLGKSMGGGLIEHARQSGMTIPPELSDPASPPVGGTDHRLPEKHRRAVLPGPRPGQIGRETPWLIESGRAGPSLNQLLVGLWGVSGLESLTTKQSPQSADLASHRSNRRQVPGVLTWPPTGRATRRSRPPGDRPLWGPRTLGRRGGPAGGS